VDPGRSPKAKGYRWHVYLPHWAVALALLVFPILRANQYRLHRRRAERGHCPTCGYDLRATPERCPECGAIPRIAPGADIPV
jgi:hypothetical protein